MNTCGPEAHAPPHAQRMSDSQSTITLETGMLVDQFTLSLWGEDLAWLLFNFAPKAVDTGQSSSDATLSQQPSHLSRSSKKSRQKGFSKITHPEFSVSTCRLWSHRLSGASLHTVERPSSSRGESLHQPAPTIFFEHQPPSEYVNNIETRSLKI